MSTSNANTPYALIERKIPDWMKSAPSTTHKALRKAVATPLPWLEKALLEQPEIVLQQRFDHVLHIQAEASLKALLKPLKKPDAFAAPLLTKAIEKRFGLKLDVRRTYLFNAKKAAAYKRADESGHDDFVVASRALKRATQSLLHCALQNFEASEAKAGGLDEEATFRSVVLDSNVFRLHVPEGKPVAIPPDEFAALARELDLGGQYQNLLSALRTPVPAQAGVSAAEDDPLLTRLKASEHASLRSHAHLAMLQGHVDADMYAALLLVPKMAHPQYRGTSVCCSFLKLWDMELTGIVAIGPDREVSSKPVPVVVFIPDDPICPLKQYESTGAFTAELRDRLRDASYLSFFQRFVPARHLNTFLSKLEDCLNPKSGFLPIGYRPRVPDPNARLPLGESEVLTKLLVQVASQKIERLQDDARFHAVPTALIDDRAFWERLEYFAQKTMQALSVAAFFVPVLGEVMMGVAAFDLAHEVFEGIDSWTKGETEQALGYLFDVLENVAFMAALGAAGHSTGMPAIEHTPVEMPSFIEELDAIDMPNGEPRLWKPDLEPFGHDIVLPGDLRPNEFGVYEYQGKTWLTVEDRAYSIRPTETPDLFKIEHPTDPSRYEPTVRHNGAGNWLYETDRPLQWEGIQLFRRSGPHNVHFSDEVANRILRITDTHEAVLRRIVSEGKRLPGQLEDTLQRFFLDEKVAQHLADAPFSDRSSLFHRLYSEQQPPQSLRDEMILEAGPRLPAAIRQELLREATAAELQALDQRVMPPRLKAEIDAYLPNVRLTRAYENLFISSVRSLDTDKLIMHTLERLPGWQQQVRIEIHDGAFAGPLQDSIGPTDAAITRFLSREPDGYRLQPTDGGTGEGGRTLYSAIAEALPAAQLTALGLTTDNAAAGLEQQVQQAPLMPRKALRELLGIPARQPGFVPPMRLADGRIGYPLSGRGALAGYILRDTLLDMIRLLGIEEHYPLSAESILSQLESTGMTRPQIFSRFQQLLEERQTLELAMINWAAESASTVDLPARTSSRTNIGRAIWRHWFSTSLLELGGIETTFHLNQANLADFPSQLPGFIYERTRNLDLLDMGLDAPGGIVPFSPQGLETLQGFLERFPRLTSLTVCRWPTDAHLASPFPNIASLVVQQLPQLRTLRLGNLGLAVDASDFSALTTLTQLQTLDLSGAYLPQTALPPLRNPSLRHLTLDQASLDQWPAWLDAEALENLETLSLRYNRISELPDFLLSQSTAGQSTTRISLQGNPLPSAQIWRFGLETPRRFVIEMDIPDFLRIQINNARNQLTELRVSIDQWTHSSSSGAIPNAETLEARARLGEVLIDYWRTARTRQGVPLNLVDVDLAHFPQLPMFFQALVQNLVLTRVAATAEQLNTFLTLFPHLSELQFSGHVQPMTALPRALSNMRNLQALTLHDQGLLIDQAMMDSFNDINGLLTLDLSGNRLAPFTRAATSLSTLRRLYLTNTQLQAWPAWVDELLPLNLLDLNGNQLTTLPEPILANPRTQQMQSEISLMGNPLERDSMIRAHTSEGFNRRFRFQMDLPEDIQALSPAHSSSSDNSPYHSHESSPESSPESNPQPTVEPWLRSTPEENEALRQAWQQLENDAGADNLLHLVQRLEQAAPYQNAETRNGFAERVGRIIVHAARNPVDLQLFNAMAQAARVGRTCLDGALLEFNQIELRLFSEQTLQGLTGPERGAALLRLMRQSFRMESLDNIAYAGITQSGQQVLALGGRDLAEVRLAYRVLLAEALNLPLAPSSMLYEATAGVNANERNLVMAEVQRREGGTEFLDYISNNPMWVDYLRSAYEDRFTVIEDQYRQQVLALPDAFPDRAVDDLAEEYAALERRKAAEYQALIRELSTTLSL
ncbi:hypothetical protein E6B08_28150 [Pseudomonas putida]|uniref:RING-type E3 ubiquitin transferase n=1 Tax=Pseudomonas putida TaxID=303 RepID=A0A4D6XGK9_PSEPU|nr:DUF6543 domain-containing protein [Pseudomonas putida]QCI14989.1 hypothetical protein E6B08_28150 [Pseudomonas putida]